MPCFRSYSGARDTVPSALHSSYLHKHDILVYKGCEGSCHVYMHHPFFKDKCATCWQIFTTPNSSRNCCIHNPSAWRIVVVRSKHHSLDRGSAQLYPMTQLFLPRRVPNGTPGSSNMSKRCLSRHHDPSLARPRSPRVLRRSPLLR